MIWARGKNRRVPYGRKGVEDGSKRRSGTR